MKQQVEIISTTECKTVNPLGKRPYMNEDRFYSMPFKYYTWSLNNWQQAESERKVYRILMAYEKIAHSNIDKLCPVNSIHSAEINEETKTAIIL